MEGVHQTPLMENTGESGFDCGDKAAVPIRGNPKNIKTKFFYAAKISKIVKVSLSLNKVPIDDVSSFFKNENTAPPPEVFTISFYVDTPP